jgi:hypothetical protein
MVIKQMGPALLDEPSTFLTGNRCFKVRRVSLCFGTKVVLIIIPSAPLSRRAEALIFFWNRFLTRNTLSMTEGALIFHIVPLDTGLESKVSKRVMQWIGSKVGSTSVLYDSAAAGPTRNPDFHSQDWDETCRSNV